MRNVKVKRKIIDQPLDQPFRYIPLTQGKVTIIDKEDYDELSKFNWFAWNNALTNSFYAARNIPVGDKQRMTQMHRVLLNIYDPSIEVDHKDRDTLNNRKYNLRIATDLQNCTNQGRRKDNKTGFKGVSFSRPGKWQATIQFQGKQLYLGLFNSPEDAYEVYKKKAMELFGEFVCLG